MNNLPISVVIPGQALSYQELLNLEKKIVEYTNLPVRITIQGDINRPVSGCWEEHCATAAGQTCPGPAILCPKNRAVIRSQGLKIKLTEQMFGIMELLIENEGVPVSRDILCAQVVGKEWTPMDRSIDNHIARLRKQLSDVMSYESIKTIRNMGYKVKQGVFKVCDCRRI